MKILAALLVAILLSSYLSYGLGQSYFGIKQAFAQTDGWHKYSSSAMGIEISYPGPWYVDTNFLNFVSDVTLFSDFESTDDIYDERVAITIERLPIGMTLDEYGGALKVSLDVPGEQFKVVEDISVRTIAGSPGRSMVYSGYSHDPSTDTKSKVVWTIAGGKAYVLFAHARSQQYSDYLETFDQIIESFSIVDANPVERAAKYTSHHDDNYEFTIEYDTRWELVTDKDSLPYTHSVVALYAPYHGMVFSGPYAYVSAIDPSTDTTLEEYTEYVLDEYKEILYSFKVLESKESTLSGEAAREITYTWSDEGTMYKTHEIWTIHGGLVYDISFESEEEILNYYEEDYERMVSTFKLTGTAAVSPYDLEFTTYENTDYGITIQYPSNWIKSQPKGLAVGFTSPAEGRSDEYYERLAIAAVESAEQLSLDDSFKQLLSSFTTTVSSFKQLEAESATLDGHHAKYVLGTGILEGGVKVKTYFVGTMVDNRFYFLAFIGEDKKYSQYAPILKRMIDSFEIDETSLSGFYLYEGEEVGIKAQYPAGWQVKEDFEGELPSISFTATEGYRYFGINYAPLVWNMSVDEFARVAPGEFSKAFDEFRVVDTTSTTMSGYPAKKIVFTALVKIPEQNVPAIQPVAYGNVADNVQIKGALVFTIQKGVVYSVVYTTFATEYFNFIDTANKMVDSVSIDPSTISQEVSGSQFRDSDTGIELRIPSGWMANRIAYSNATALALFPIQTNADPNSEKVSILLIIENISDSLKEESKDSEESDPQSMCDKPNASYVVWASPEVKMLRSEFRCEIYGENAHVKYYSTSTADKYVSVSLFTSGEGEYNDTAFLLDNMVGAMTLPNSIDISSDSYDELYGVKSYNQTVFALNATYNVHLSTSSGNITDFAFDEAQKRVAFKVHGDSGTSGYVIVSIESILQPPYVVTIDGVEIDGYQTYQDETTNESGIVIDYSHSTREIKITGTNVVPEFPIISSVIAMATLLAAVVAIMRENRTIGKVFR